MQCTKLLPCTVCSTLWQFLSSLMCLDHMDWKAAEHSGKRHIMAHKIYVTHSVALTCSQGRGLISYIPRNHSRGYVGAELDFMPSHMKQKRPHTFFSGYQDNMQQQQRMISYFSMNNEKICERATLVSNTNSFWHLGSLTISSLIIFAHSFSSAGKLFPEIDLSREFFSSIDQHSFSLRLISILILSIFDLMISKVELHC